MPCAYERVRGVVVNAKMLLQFTMYIVKRDTYMILVYVAEHNASVISIGKNNMHVCGHAGTVHCHRPDFSSNGQYAMSLANS